jgi:hypothetical protein
MQEKSDADCMLILKNITAIEKHFRPLPHQFSIVKMEYGFCLAGYVLLRDLVSGVFLSAAEYKDFLKSAYSCHSSSNLLNVIFTDCIIHGPANTRILSNGDLNKSPLGMCESVDFVIGIHCHEWPSIADEWIERCRPFNWPSEDQRKTIIKMGCDLVPVGVPGSEKEDLQWRISFARAERFLIRSLDIVQLKTFFLLKIIFKSKVLGKLFHEKISSYVAKTAFFWVSEEHNSMKWREGLCLKYTWLCLRKILSFVKEKCCPNYFMKECNILHKKLNDNEKVLICGVLENFTREQQFANNIKNNPKISQIKNWFSGKIPAVKKLIKSKWVSDMIEQFTQRIIEEALGYQTTLFTHESGNSNWKDAVEELSSFLRNVRGEQSAIYLCNPSAQKLIIRLLLCAQIRLMNVLICHGFASPEKRFSMITNFCLFPDLRTEAIGVNEIVQIAHVYFTNSFYESTLQILSPMLGEVKVCPMMYNPVRTVQSVIHSVFCFFFLNMANTSLNSLRRPFCSLSFHKLEESILTDHLRLEINSYKLDCERSGTFEFELYVLVSPLVYAYYMKYKCCRLLGRNKDSCVALRELETQVFNGNIHMYHHLNLLGCSLYESGHYEEALKTFASSYKQRNSRHSVLFHICILLLKCFKNRSHP